MTTNKNNVVLHVTSRRMIAIHSAALVLGALMISDRAHYFTEARVDRKRVLVGRLVDNNRWRLEMTRDFFQAINRTKLLLNLV